MLKNAASMGGNSGNNNRGGGRRFLGAPESKGGQLAASKSFLIMVYGAPSSGKSTFADKFSAEYKTPFVNLGRILESFEKLAASVDGENQPAPAMPAAKAKAGAKKKSAGKTAAAAQPTVVQQPATVPAGKPEEKLDFSKYGLSDDFDFNLFADPAPNIEPAAPVAPVTAPEPVAPVMPEPVEPTPTESTSTEYRHSRERTLIKETALAIVTGMLESKQTILLEGGVDTKAERDYLREVATMAGYQPLLLWVQTDLATLKQRLTRAPKAERLTKKQFETALARLEAPTAIEHPIVISGKHTFDTQIRTVFGQLVRI